MLSNQDLFKGIEASGCDSSYSLASSASLGILLTIPLHGYWIKQPLNLNRLTNVMCLFRPIRVWFPTNINTSRPFWSCVRVSKVMDFLTYFEREEHNTLIEYIHTLHTYLHHELRTPVCTVHTNTIQITQFYYCIITILCFVLEIIFIHIVKNSAVTKDQAIVITSGWRNSDQNSRLPRDLNAWIQRIL